MIAICPLPRTPRLTSPLGVTIAGTACLLCSWLFGRAAGEADNPHQNKQRRTSRDERLCVISGGRFHDSTLQRMLESRYALLAIRCAEIAEMVARF